MDRRTRTLFAVLLLAVIVGTAVAAIVLTEPGPDPDVVPSASAPTASAPSTGPSTSAAVESTTGVVVSVDASGLTDVRGFVLRQPGGALLTLSLRALENPSHLPPGHLAEHQATAAPVRVWYRTEGGENLALRVEDAPSG